MRDFQFSFNYIDYNSQRFVSKESLLLFLHQALINADNEQEKNCLTLLIQGINKIK